MKKDLYLLLIILMLGSHATIAQVTPLPASGAQGNVISINITGTGTAFLPGMTNCAQIELDGQIYQISGFANTPTNFTGQLDILCEAPLGSYDLTVFEGPGCVGTEWSCSDCFTVNAIGQPSLVVIPTSGALHNINNLTIIGTNTCFIPGTTVCGEFVSSSGISYPITGSATTSINFTGTVDLPCTAAPGLYDILIYENPDCEGTQFECTDCFTVNPLSGGSISLSTPVTERGAMLDLQLTGTATCFEAGTTDCVELTNGSSTYSLTGTATSINEFDANTFLVPCDAPLGNYDVTVYQEAGCSGFSWSCTGCLTVTDPANPIGFPVNSSLRGATANLDIVGVCTDFLVGSTDCAIITNGTNSFLLDNGSASSSTDFTGTLDLPVDAPTGSFDAIIYQDAGCTGISWSCTDCFTINDSIGISPVDGLRGRVVPLTVTGRNTAFNLTTTTCLELTGNGNTYTITSGYALSPTSFFVDFDLTSANITAGSYDAKIYKGVGCAGEYWSCNDCFTIKDSISISPANEDPGNTVALTITGTDTDFQTGVTNCVQVTNGSVTYTFNGTAADALTFSGNFDVPIDAPFGDYDVLIYQGADCTGQSWSCTNCFEVSGAPLPVEWLYLRAERVAKEIAVYWGTAAERNSDLFVIERSSNGKDWEAIGHREAAGFSNRNIDYHFIDKAPLHGYNYYRIQQYDLDGNFETGEVVAVSFSNAIYGFTVAPNPVHGQASLYFSMDQKRPVNIRVMTISGQQLFVAAQLFDEGAHEFELPMQNLPKGVYILSVESGGNLQMQKIVKL